MQEFLCGLHNNLTRSLTRADDWGRASSLMPRSKAPALRVLALGHCRRNPSDVVQRRRWDASWQTRGAGNPSSRWLHAQKMFALDAYFCCLLHDCYAIIASRPRDRHVQGAAPSLRADWPRVLACHKRSLPSSSPLPASYFSPQFHPQTPRIQHAPGSSSRSFDAISLPRIPIDCRVAPLQLPSPIVEIFFQRFSSLFFFS